MQCLKRMANDCLIVLVKNALIQNFRDRVQKHVKFFFSMVTCFLTIKIMMNETELNITTGFTQY